VSLEIGGGGERSLGGKRGREENKRKELQENRLSGEEGEKIPRDGIVGSKIPQLKGEEESYGASLSRI